MLYLLNELAQELYKSASGDAKPGLMLQKKLDLWKENHLEETEKEALQKRAYQEKHDLPRKEREQAQKEFMEGYRRLRKEYVMATTTKKKASLDRWIAYSAKLPEVLMTEASPLFSMYPYGKDSIWDEKLNVPG